MGTRAHFKNGRKRFGAERHQNKGENLFSFKMHQKKNRIRYRKDMNDVHSFCFFFYPFRTEEIDQFL